MTPARKGRAHAHDLACAIDGGRCARPPAVRSYERSEILHPRHLGPKEGVSLTVSGHARADDLARAIDRSSFDPPARIRETLPAERSEILHPTRFSPQERMGVSGSRLPPAYYLPCAVYTQPLPPGAAHRH